MDHQQINAKPEREIDWVPLHKGSTVDSINRPRGPAEKGCGTRFKGPVEGHYDWLDYHGTFESSEW